MMIVREGPSNALQVSQNGRDVRSPCMVAKGDQSLPRLILIMVVAIKCFMFDEDKLPTCNAYDKDYLPMM